MDEEIEDEYGSTFEDEVGLDDDEFEGSDVEEEEED